MKSMFTSQKCQTLKKSNLISMLHKIMHLLMRLNMELTQLTKRVHLGGGFQLVGNTTPQQILQNQSLVHPPQVMKIRGPTAHPLVLSTEDPLLRSQEWLKLQEPNAKNWWVLLIF